MRNILEVFQSYEEIMLHAYFFNVVTHSILLISTLLLHHCGDNKNFSEVIFFRCNCIQMKGCVKPNFNG